MRQYLDLMQKINDIGNHKGDRTGTGTLSIFGYQMRYNLEEGFPLVTTKKIYWKGVVHELLWFLKGSTNIAYLTQNGVRIWDAWATEDGSLGPVYGQMWRSWPTTKYMMVKGQYVIVHGYIDQISDVVERIKATPNSRRLIVSAWNPAVLPDESISPQENVNRGKQALAPCHTLFQFYVHDGKLSCQLYQRSMDTALGAPFNIASYSLLTHMIAHVCGLRVGEFIHTVGDAHLYVNHLDYIEEQLQRYPLPLPTLKLNPDVKNIFDFTYDDIILENYQYHPPIKMPISV